MLEAEEEAEEDLIEARVKDEGQVARGCGDDWKLLVGRDHPTCGPYFC